MVGGLKGSAAAARRQCPRQNILVHFQVGLEFQCRAYIPLLLACQSGEKFLAEGGCILAGHRGDLPVFPGTGSPAEHFERLHGYREKRFALEECEQIAIETRVHLQSVAPVLNHVGINESGDNALTNEALAQAFGKDRSAIGEEASGFGSGRHR
jgi:hypothetical protein